jgi:hypothetical protein
MHVLRVHISPSTHQSEYAQQMHQFLTRMLTLLRVCISS